MNRIGCDRILIQHWLRPAVAPLMGVVLSPLMFSKMVLAQLIVPDNTLGAEQSVVAPGGTADDLFIEGGAQRNTALFHSFERFGISPNQTVFFSNPAAVENIFARVTGGMASNINGLLGVDGPANLFFVNPSGILFGPNAQLDMAGAFVATTADRFLLPNGNSFSAVNPNAPPLLTVSVPLGVQFGAPPQPISVNGATLETAVGEPLALLGGAVNLDGAEILAPGGRVGLSGLSQPGTLLFDLEAATPDTFLTVPVRGRSSVTLNNSTIDTVEEGGGDIVFQAENIFLNQTNLFVGLNEDVDDVDAQGGAVLLNGTGDIQLTESTVRSLVEDLGQGETIRISAQNLTLQDNSQIFTSTLGDSSSGDIRIDLTNRLRLERGSEILSRSSADGFMSDAGSILINAPDVSLSFSSGISSESAGSGGDISITTNSLLVREESDIRTRKFGPNTSEGDIRIQANTILVDDRGGPTLDRPPIGITTSVTFFPEDLGLPPETLGGTGGDIEIDTQNLTLIGGLIAPAVFGNAQGGNLTIRAGDTVQLIGDPSAARRNFAGVAELSTAIRDSTTEGFSGDIRINARHLILRDGSIIDAGAEGLGNSGDIFINTTESVTLQGTLNGQPSRILTQLQNPGAFEGGNIDLVTGRLTIQDGGQISTSTTPDSIGNGGDISVVANQNLLITGSSPRVLLPAADADSPLVLDSTNTLFPSGIFATAPGDGNAGGIEVFSPNITLRNGAQLSVSSTNDGSAGSLFVRSNTFILDDAALLAESVEGSQADIGLIVRDSLQLLNGSRISTVAGGNADGGNIEVMTGQLTIRDGGQISASTTADSVGNGGIVRVNANQGISIIGSTPSPTGIFTSSLGEGDAGDVEIVTPTLEMSNGAQVSVSSSAGAAGFLSIDANKVVLDNSALLAEAVDGNLADIQLSVQDSLQLLNGSRISTVAGGNADGGNIELATGQLTIRDGSQILASTTADSVGNGGIVRVEANQGISIFGSSLVPSGIFASSLGEGDAGDVEIVTPSFMVSNGAQVSVSSVMGAAGFLSIDANKVVLDNSALLAEAVEGNLANIELSVRDSLQLLNRSRISTVARDEADGGNIFIGGTDTQLLRFLTLQGGSIISAENSGGFGNGGSIDIAAQFIIAFPSELNRIIANAFEGDGGDIDIFTNAIFGPQFLNISASSQLGLNGEINIETIATDPTTALTQLPENVLDKSTQIADACAVPSTGQSQFVVTGRGGLPLMPSSRPAGSYLLTDLGTQAPADGTTVLQEAKRLVVTARGDYYLQGESSLPELLEKARQTYLQANYADAVVHWTQAANQLSNHPGIYAAVQSHLALAYHHLGDWDKAREAMAASQKTLTPDMMAEQPALHAQVFSARASLFLARGDTRSALEDWQTAAKAYQRAGDDAGNLQVQLNQIQVLQDLGYLRQAQQQLVPLMQILEQQPPSPVKAMTQLNLGKVSRAEGNMLRSQRQIEAALSTAQSLNQPALTSTILLNLGHTFRGQGNTQKALDYYQQAHRIAPTSLIQFQVQVSRFDLLVVKKDPAVSQLFQELQDQMRSLPSSREGIYTQLHLIETVLTWGQREESSTVLHLLNQVEGQAQELDDPNAQSYVLGYQGRIYGEAKQWSQAVLLTEKALQQVQRQQSPEVLYQLAWQLGRYRRQLGNRQGAISAYLDAVAALDSLRGDLRTASDDVRFTFRDGVEPIYRELVGLLLEGDMTQADASSNLNRARNLIEDLQLNEIQDYFQDACVQAKPQAVDQVDPNAAVIYPIVLEDRVDLIVSIGTQPLRHFSTPMEPGQVDDTVKQLLRSLTTPLGSVQKRNLTKLKQIYDLVVGPAAEDLAQQDVETLVFVADGALRTLPLTTLHDGEQYLIEKYNVALSPGLDLLAPLPQDREKVKVLVGGVSEARSGFPALPYVAKEVEQITSQIQDHAVLFNQDLTQQNLNDYLTEVSSEVVHLATHAEFGASPEDTFILTWEGRLSIQAMASLLRNRIRTSEVPIDLLVLSACETATGNSRAVLGIAGMAIRSGVRSTLAGLWSLDDQAAAAFMGHFYKALAQPNTTKASAFRQAQLALMKDPQFRAPYFWGPFVLVGNWL
ncbi:CHAT domain-containing protein [Acaryochloris marina NIES-2412]|uniref:CHAT domain-containing protein n=1 Tax=Acaryochloris marina TaxID=155978 RepID=UPI00405921A4